MKKDSVLVRPPWIPETESCIYCNRSALIYEIKKVSNGVLVRYKCQSVACGAPHKPYRSGFVYTRGYLAMYEEFLKSGDKKVGTVSKKKSSTVAAKE